MKRYDYVEKVLMSAVLCDAATEISLGNKRGLRSAWQLVLNLGENKKELTGKGKLCKQMKFHLSKISENDFRFR